MRLKDENLEKAVCYKVGKYGDEELTEADLEEVDELNISNKTFSGKDRKIDLEELSLFPNIRTLFLQYFTIDDSIMEIINSLPNLTSLQLASCKVVSKQGLENKNMKSLLLNCCSIKDYGKICAPESLTIIGEDNLKLDKILGKEEIQRMYLQSSNIKNFNDIKNYPNLQLLNIDGSKVDNSEALNEIAKKVPVSHKEDYTPIR